MTRTAFQQLLSILAIVVASGGAAGACSYFAPLHKVGRTFNLRIVDHGVPVRGVKVELSKNSTSKPFANLVSDKDGLVEFSSVPTGSYTLTTKPGNLNWIFLEVSPSNKASAPIEIEWPNLPRFEVSLLSGQLRTGLYPEAAHKSEPVSNLKLRLLNPIDNREVAETATDSSGVFLFDHVPDGTYFLHLGGREGSSPWDGDIYIVIRGKSPSPRNLGVTYVAMTSCGLMASSKQYKF